MRRRHSPTSPLRQARARRHRSSRIWAISDGAAIYPRAIFTRGLRFYEGFLFGASYLEWGSRLHWLGYEIRHLDDTYVIHHYDPDTRSIKDVRGESAAALFAGLCHSFIYQPTLRNRLLTLVQFPVTVTRFRTTGVRACLDALGAFREQRRISRRAVAPSDWSSRQATTSFLWTSSPQQIG